MSEPVTKAMCSKNIKDLKVIMEKVNENVDSAHGRLSFWRNVYGLGLMSVVINCALAIFGLYVYINSVSSHAAEKSMVNDKRISLIGKDITHIKEKVDKQGDIQQKILEEVRSDK